MGDSFPTDECGAFSANSPAGAVGIRAKASGFRPLQAEIDVFVGEGATGLASTISSTSSYQIGTLQVVDDGTLAFSVTDSESRQSVLGIPAAAFTLLLDDTSLTPYSVFNASSATNNESATVVLTLDASGSMGDTAFIEDNGVRYSRYQLATLAAHQFLGQKATEDAIQLAKSYGIPIYTVGMDSDRAADDLFRVADETGGAYFNVTSTLTAPQGESQ